MAETRYFQIDTRDTDGNPQTYYAAWRYPSVVLFFISDGKAQVQWVQPLKVVEQLRSKVQIGPDGFNGGGIADVVGFQEISRPDFNDVDPGSYGDRDNVLNIGTILEV